MLSNNPSRRAVDFVAGVFVPSAKVVIDVKVSLVWKV
jgi:hypothetical protein